MMRVVNSIYDAATTGDGWHGVLVDIADLSRAENAALVIVDPRAALSSVTAPRADPDIVTRYTGTWWQKDITAHATASKPVGVLTTLQDTGRQRFFSSEFYNDFWRTSGLGAERIAANLFIDNDAFASFVLQASPSDDDIDVDAIQLMEMLVPHMVRAAGIQRTLHRLCYQRDLARAGGGRLGVGALLVDRHARLVFADENGEAILRARDDLRLDMGALRLAAGSDTARLLALVGSCSDRSAPTVRGGRMTTSADPDRDPLRLDILPYGGAAPEPDFLAAAGSPPTAIVLLADPAQKREAALAVLQDRFGLTPAECCFALEILRGDGRQAAAERLGISLSTARTHLTRIFDKTGVNRQAELVGLLSGCGFDR